MTEFTKEYLAILEGIEFSQWHTEVENDELTLVGIKFGGHEKIEYVQEGVSIEMDFEQGRETNGLEAIFISKEKRVGVKFMFENVSAFRVLDEHGLVDLWNASKNNSRPARTTFRVKGHRWQTESELSWVMADCEYSFMIATGWDCLEVVAWGEPKITFLPAIVCGPTTY